MWSRRSQEYEQKINSGKIYELAEVVKDLNKNSNAIADQSYSERQLFEKAYDRLQSEFEAVLKVSPDDAKKKMDKALGRNQNLEAQ
jgi:CarD family transcriptional regulator